MPKHSSQFTRKQNQIKEKRRRRPPQPHPRMAEEYVQPPPLDFERTAHTPGFTNRIQEYLGTYVPGRVTPNQMATMPQNYYKFNPANINRQIIYQNFMTDNTSLSLPEFKHQLAQLYRQNHLQPIPLSQEEEDFFNELLPIVDGVAPVQLRMNLPFPTVIPLYSNDDDPTMCTINSRLRWGVSVGDSETPTLLITTIQQIDRFILRDCENDDPNDNISMGEKRIRNLGLDEVDCLIDGIENGVSPPANTRLSIVYDWGVYNTYADLAHAMGIRELQVANMEAAPFMATLLSPAARTEFEFMPNAPFRPRRNSTRKCRK